MGQQENWFSRHKMFVFAFALVVILLNVLLLMLLPQQTAILWDGQAMEYAVDDESFAEPRTVHLAGTLTSSVIGGTSFDGALTISGYDLDGTTLHLTRKNKRWEGSFRDSAGQLFTAQVHELYGTKDFQSLVIDLWTRYDQTDTQRTAAMRFDHAHFISLDAQTRAVALRTYQSYAQFAQN